MKYSGKIDTSKSLVDESIKIIESCTTYNQLLSAGNFVDLAIKEISKSEPKSLRWAQTVLSAIINSQSKFVER
jgi:hypothetical protein